jgi:hypothetical protein
VNIVIGYVIPERPLFVSVKVEVTPEAIVNGSAGAGPVAGCWLKKICVMVAGLGLSLVTEKIVRTPPLR